MGSIWRAAVCCFELLLLMLGLISVGVHCFLLGPIALSVINVVLLVNGALGNGVAIDERCPQAGLKVVINCTGYQCF